MERRLRPTSNSSSQLHFLAAPCEGDEEAMAAVDEAFFGAIIKLRDIAQNVIFVCNNVICCYHIHAYIHAMRIPVPNHTCSALAV